MTPMARDVAHPPYQLRVPQHLCGRERLRGVCWGGGPLPPEREAMTPVTSRTVGIAASNCSLSSNYPAGPAPLRPQLTEGDPTPKEVCGLRGLFLLLWGKTGAPSFMSPSPPEATFPPHPKHYACLSFSGTHGSQ